MTSDTTPQQETADAVDAADEQNVEQTEQSPENENAKPTAEQETAAAPQAPSEPVAPDVPEPPPEAAAIARLEQAMTQLHQQMADLLKQTEDVQTRTSLISDTQKISADQLRRFGAKVEQAAVGAANSQFRRLADGLILFFDLIDGMAETENPEALDPPHQICQMLSRQLLQLLQANGVDTVPTEGAPDYQMHRAAGSAAVQSSDQDGKIVAVERPGFRMGDRVLRPADVILGAVEKPAAEDASPDDAAADDTE